MICTTASNRGLGVRAVAIALMLACSLLVSVQVAPVLASGHLPEDTSVAAGPPPQQQGDDLDGDSELPWLFAVFFITWAAFFTYVFYMARRQKEMGREIEALKRALAERERETLQAGQGS